MIYLIIKHKAEERVQFLISSLGLHMHTLICTHTYIHTLCGYTVYMQTVYVETLPQSLIYLLIHTFVPKNTFTYLYPAHTYTDPTDRVIAYD